MGRGIGQANCNAIGKDDFGGRSLGNVNNLDRNERCFAGRTCLLAMFAEPTMNGVERTTNLVGNLADGLLGFENEREGSLTNFGTVGARHEKLNEK